MTPRPLPDEDARRRVRTDLEHNFMVEAGAGTGKTRLLVDRIEALVASGRVSLRKVVAITLRKRRPPSCASGSASGLRPA